MQQLYRYLLTGLTAAILVVGTVGAAGAATQTLPPAEQALRTAAQLYARGEFAAAAQSYRQLVDQGYGDGALYYNMGQAYLQAGDRARALWAFRSAAEFAPRDDEIRAAVAQTREQLAESGDAQDAAWQLGAATDLVERLDATVGRWVTLNELAILALGLWIAFVGFALLALMSHNDSRRRWFRMAALGIGVCLFVSIVSLGMRTAQFNSRQDAIVVATQVELRSAPGSEYPGKMNLYHGAEVSVDEARGNWVHLTADTGGGSGWAPAESVITVAPYALYE